jgi:hypothetical protein
VLPDIPRHAPALEKQGKNRRRRGGQARSSGSQATRDHLGTAIALSLSITELCFEDPHKGDFALRAGQPGRVIPMIKNMHCIAAVRRPRGFANHG